MILMTRCLARDRRGLVSVLGMLLLLMATLPGCGDKQEAAEARETVRVMWETMRGAPNAEALGETARFSHAGIEFDYPKPLRETHERIDGDDVWFLRYGLYEVEVWISREAVDIPVYLEAIGHALAASDGARTLEPVAEGETLTLCGAKVVTSSMRVVFADVNSRYQAFALPAASGPGSRVILLTDARMDEKESPVADAVEKMVLSTLRCRDPKHPRQAGDNA